jgi:hypothetical protein
MYCYHHVKRVSEIAMNNSYHLAMIGWREWVSLPELGIEAIKAKVDTGARTTSLHAHYLETYHKNGEQWVKFKVHPFQQRHDIDCECHALVTDYRKVTDSGGHAEHRYVINTLITLGSESFLTEVTLSNRESMQFRMLIGRNTLKKRYAVNVNKSFMLEHMMRILKKKTSKRTS